MRFKLTPSLNITHFLLVALITGFVSLGTPAWGQVVNEDLKLFASDGAAGDQFGSSVAIDNDVLVVGAPDADDGGIDSGAAYLFQASTGIELLKFTPTDGAAGDAFGFSVAIAGGIVAVGAPGKDDNGADSGAAYLFDASTGAQLAKLLPGDGAAGDEFGNSIAIDDGIVAVGAWRADEHGDDSGAVYLFNASTGNQLDKLLPDTGNNYQTFGVSIAMDAGIVAIGARTFFVLGEGYTFAKAYLFDVVTGNQLNVLKPDIENYNGDLGGQFADSIDIDNGLVAVGTPSRSVFFDFSGAAYVFDASTGEQLHFIFPADGHDRDHFGASISIDNGVLAIGADEDDDSAWSAGSTYLYDAGDATLIDKLLVSDGAGFDRFGSSMAIGNCIVAAGAIGYGSSGTPTGYVGVFMGPPATTVSASLSCLPNSGIVPFNTSMQVTLNNEFAGQNRRVAAQLDALLASGASYPAWRSGSTNIAAGGNFITSWNQAIPALGLVIGENVFTLRAEDVTPAPFNQPPYPAAGDTGSSTCTVTGIAP